ncbi:nucleoporin Nup37 [Frankliniella occidentalis]|uniref:Nucleoporin Nup37 n=1 Tax=Frankliniella occidentalis TaxID=133901 RepID=A0A6J1SS27_FRAOC|nr:nucleoporin Nup37 [Frankliniella occidentalis]
MVRNQSFLSQTLPNTTNTDNSSRKFVLSFSSQIFQAEFSPYEWSQNLLCIALKDKVVVGTLSVQEEDENSQESVEFSIIHEFYHVSRVHAIAWSPDASVSALPKLLSFYTADSDFKVCHFDSTRNGNKFFKTLGSHTDYINALACDPERNYLASVSDDQTCQLWPLKDEGGEVILFYLSSPGMSVSWHRQEPSKLLVAEKAGLIHMYNIETQRAILSVDAAQVPLMSADWSPSNCSRVGCVAGSDLIIRDVTAPSSPVETRPIHMEGGQLIRFSPTSENHVATIGRSDHQLKVSHVGSSQPILTAMLQVFGGLSWHYRLPLLCAGSDRKLVIFKVLTK